jgi:hypothetical protein
MRQSSGRAAVFVEERHEDGLVVMKGLDPRPIQAVWNHSPDGFEWGYFGSGPAQLALAILYDVYVRREMGTKQAAEVALEYHHEFKDQYVAKFKPEGFRLPISAIALLSF